MKADTRAVRAQEVLENASLAIVSLVALVLPVIILPNLSDTFYQPKLTFLSVSIALALALLYGGRLLQSAFGGRSAGTDGGDDTGGRSLGGMAPAPGLLDIAVVVFLAVAALATVMAVNPGLSLIGKFGRPEGLLALFAYGGLYLVVSRIGWSRVRLVWFLGAAVTGAVLVSAYAFLQATGADPIRWGAAPFSPVRFASTLGNPILLASYLALAVAAVIGLINITRSTLARAAAVAALAPIVGALWLSQGRAGFAAAAAGAIVYGVVAAYLRRSGGEHTAPGVSRAAWLLVVGIAAALVIGIVSAQVALSGGPLGKASSAETAVARDAGSLQDRFLIWESGLELIAARPATGWGPDSFQLVFPGYQNLGSARLENQGEPVGASAEDAHNVLLQTAGTMGLIGLAALLFLVLSAFWTALATRQPGPGSGGGLEPGSSASGSKEDPANAVTALALAAVTAFAVASLLTPVVSASAIFFWAALGLVAARPTSPVAEAAKDSPPRPASDSPQRRSEALAPLSTIALFVLVPVAAFVVFLLALPFAAEWKFSQAEKAWGLGKHPQAAAAYASAHRLNPLRDKYLGQYGERLVEKGGFTSDPPTVQAGTEVLARAKEINPREPSYALALGLANLKLIASDRVAVARAKFYFGEAAALAPNDPRANYWLGQTTLMAAQSVEDAQAAERRFRRAISIAPRYFEAHKSLGTLYQILGKRAPAIAELKKADNIRPGDAEVKRALESLQKRGE